ncbi:Uncharacterized protein AC517_2034 [Pseudomonas syringae pv. syringae]|nr:Uncharacterized protein AC517_2034 [Pseudomonas syringae pv. syringae]
MLTGSDYVLQQAISLFGFSDYRLGQCLQGNTWHVQAFDTLLANMLEQAAEIQTGITVDKRQFATCTQGAEDFLKGHIKTQRGELQDALPRATVLDSLGDLPMHQIDQRRMGHGHAFGLSGRARGVDQVSQVLRAKPRKLRIGRRRAVNTALGAGISLQQQHRQDGLRNALAQTALGQQHFRCAVLKHVGQTFRRVRRVEWYVACAGLENAHQARDHFQTAFRTDRHPVISTNAFGDQPMGNLVSPLIELEVTQLLAFVGDCHRVGLRSRLGLEQLVQQNVLRVAAVECVEVFQQLATLVHGQPVEAVQGCIGPAVQRVGQLLQHGVHVTADTPGTDSGHCLNGQAEGFAEVVHRQGQWVVGALFTAEYLDTAPKPGLPCLLRCLGADRDMAVVHQCTE